MSLQIFLEGKLTGIEPYLLSGEPDDEVLLGRSRWVALLAEVLPRALLAELNLARILLGSSGGGQFLLVLPDEARGPAEQFLRAAGEDLDLRTGSCLKLIWASTENLGEWGIVRRRLTDEMQRKKCAPVGLADASFFEPFDEPSHSTDNQYTLELSHNVREIDKVGWSPDAPTRISTTGGKHSWTLGTSPDSISIARHAAPGNDDRAAATPHELAGRAQGSHAWGVLRGSVDSFDIRLRRAQTVEEHVQLSVVYKQFFAGELEVLCSMPEFWRKVAIVYSGMDDFAVYGAWDALIPLAREIHRLFHRFAEENLKDMAGPEGKTLTAALALAPDDSSSLASVFELAGQNLDTARASSRDSIHLFGRTLEWKQINDAVELKDLMTRLVIDYGCSPQFLMELASFYREGAAGTESRGRARARGNRFEKPWRLHRRLSRLLEAPRDREFQRLRQNMIGELIGKGTAQWRLRPAGRVALEWAGLLAGPEGKS